ncbi:MAG TPA: AsmA family protein [Gammaproteobacteria bacterium]|nr:AsmA family protein [Gammaproteobacteria bacterium]
MKRFLKISGAVITLLVVIGVSLVFILPHVINPNDYRQPIERLVHDRIGRKLEITGDLHLSVFPWIGLEVGAMRLANAPGFGSTPFATLNSAEIKVRLLPLLAGKVEAGAVRIDGLDLHLERNAKGQSNWQGLVRHAASEPSGKPAPAKQPAGGGTPLPITSLSVRSLEVRKASLEWHDAQTGRHFRLHDLRLDTGEIAPGKPFHTRLAFGFDGDKPKLSLHAVFSGQAAMTPASQRYSISGAKISADMSGPAVPGGKQEISGSFDALADLKQGTASVTGLKVRTSDLTLNGAVSAAGLDGKPKVSGRITLPDFSPRKVMHALALKIPQTRDDSVLRHASLDAGFDATRGKLLLHNLSLRLDDSHVSGALTADTAGKVPDVTGHLKIDRIDADRYLPPPQNNKQAKADPPVDPPAGPALPLGMLDKVDGKVRLQIGRLIAHNVHLQDLDTTVRINSGALSLQPLKAKLYDGSLAGELHVDNRRPGKPALAVDSTLKGVKTGVLLKDAVGKPFVTGTGTIRTALAATGASVDTMTRTLNGTVRLDLSNGTIYGVDVLQKLRGAWLQHQGDQPAGGQATGPGASTGYANLGATVKIRNGIAHNDDLLMTSPLLHVTGKGQADLVKRRVDYTAQVTVLGTGTGTGDKVLGNLKGQPIPVNVTGPLASPSIRPDIRGMLENKAHRKVQQKKQELENRLRQKLKNLFR